MANNELNYIIILSRVCVMPKVQGLFEETSRTLVTPSSPKEAIRKDPYGLHHQSTIRLELYNSDYYG